MAIASDTPLEGELPPIQLVVPEFTANMNGVVVEAPCACAVASLAVTKSVAVLKSVEVAVRVMVGRCESDSSAD